MNKEVTLTGMEVKTHVGSNLLIQAGALTDTTTLDEAGFITDETQLLTAVLEPVSTIDGKTFFYTVDAKADGSKLHQPIGAATDDTVNYTAYSDGLEGATGASAASYGNKFSQDYEASKTFVNTFVTDEDSAYRDSAVGYVDYVFQLKATNTDGDSNKDINLTQLDLTYGDGTDDNKAYRAAIFVSEAVDAGGTFANWTTLPNTLSANAIYTPEDAENFDRGKAVDSTTTRNTVDYTSSATAIATVPANSIKYYKVVVRLWIEGEDTTCNTSTFKALTDSWSLDLTMELGQGEGVTNIGMEVTSGE